VRVGLRARACVRTCVGGGTNSQFGALDVCARSRIKPALTKFSRCAPAARA
jgi:hypothetical protein